MPRGVSSRDIADMSAMSSRDIADMSGEARDESAGEGARTLLHWGREGWGVRLRVQGLGFGV